MTLLRNKRSLKPLRKNLRNNQTDAERKLWYYGRNQQFFGLRFNRQYSVGNYILDFYCPEKKIAIELDGSQHVDMEQQDSKRTLFLQQFDIRVIRFWNTDVMKNIEGVLQGLDQHIHSPQGSNAPNPSLSKEGKY